MDPATRTNSGPTIGIVPAALMLDQAQGILNQAREALKDHPRAAAPIIGLAFAQLEWLGRCQTFAALAPAYGLTTQDANRLTEVPVPTAQQRQRAEQFAREIEQHA